MRGNKGNLLNPKLTVFFFVFLPHVVHVDQPRALAHLLGLFAVSMLLTLLVFAGYGLASAGMRGQVLTRPRVVIWMRRVFAGSYVALAGRLALADR